MARSMAPMTPPKEAATLAPEPGMMDWLGAAGAEVGASEMTVSVIVGM